MLLSSSRHPSRAKADQLENLKFVYRISVGKSDLEGPQGDHGRETAVIRVEQERTLQGYDLAATS